MSRTADLRFLISKVESLEREVSELRECLDTVLDILARMHGLRDSDDDVLVEEEILDTIDTLEMMEG